MQGLWPFIQQGARVAQWVRSLDLTTHTSLSPIRRGFAPSFVNYKKGCTRLASDKVCQLLVHGRGSLRVPPPLKTGCHDIAEILLKVALKHQKSINLYSTIFIFFPFILHTKWQLYGTRQPQWLSHQNSASLLARFCFPISFLVRQKLYLLHHL